MYGGGILGGAIATPHNTLLLHRLRRVLSPMTTGVSAACSSAPCRRRRGLFRKTWGRGKRRISVSLRESWVEGVRSKDRNGWRDVLEVLEESMDKE